MDQGLTNPADLLTTIANAGDTPAPAPAATSIEGGGSDFYDRVNALIAASGGRLSIRSGRRSNAEQQKLWEGALKKYGSVSAARKWVAPPGRSNHEKGLAADLGGDLALAHKLAPQFGLTFPMPWEDWHIEPAGLRSHPDAYTAAPPGYPNPADPSAPASTTDHLATLVHALHLAPEDQQAAKQGPTTPAAGTAAPTAVAAPSAPAAAAGAPAPAAQPAPTIASGDPMAFGGAATDPASLLTTVADVNPSIDDVNAAAGAAGMQGNPSGQGAVKSTPERLAFANALLEKLGMPITTENQKLLLAWQQAEGTSAAFNPLATTDHAPGSTSFNSNGGVPVQNFTSFEQGVDTTVRTLTNGRYGNILAALQQGNNAVAVAQAIAASPWGTGALVLKILGG